MTPEEKLRQMLSDYERAETGSAAIGEHLTDEDFMRLIENSASLETEFAANRNGDSAAADKLAPLRRHLAACDSCLDQFKGFYAFFAPAETGETVATKSEIVAAWQRFAPRIAEKKDKPKFWSQLFSFKNNSNRFAAFGWGFAALLLVFTGLAVFVAWQAKNENSQLAAQLEREKQSSVERLTTLEQAARNSNAAAGETGKLQAEKQELQDKIAQLQTEIERAKQQKPERNEILPPKNSPSSSQEKPDNSLVAVNTPIYDVFPSEAVVRGGEQTANNLVVPNGAKSIVLILNAAGRADFPISNAALTDSAGKTVWRGGGLRKDTTGNFTLTLSRAALKTGSYRLKLSGATAAIEYPLTVEIGK